MTIHQSGFGDSQGSPNIEILQYYKDNWGPDRIAAATLVAKKSVTADATSGLAVDIPEGAKIIDVVVECKATNGSGTMQVKTGADSPVTISDAIACDTDKAIARAASIDYNYNVVGADGIIVISNGAADRGDVFITYLK